MKYIIIVLILLTNDLLSQEYKWVELNSNGISVKFQFPTTWTGKKIYDDHLKYSFFSNNNSHIYSIEISEILKNKPSNAELFNSSEFYDNMVKFHLTQERAIELSCGNIIPEYVNAEYIKNLGHPKFKYSGPTDIKGLDCESYGILHINEDRVVMINIYGGHISNPNLQARENHKKWLHLVESIYVIEGEKSSSQELKYDKKNQQTSSDIKTSIPSSEISNYYATYLGFAPVYSYPSEDIEFFLAKTNQKWTNIYEAEGDYYYVNNGFSNGYIHKRWVDKLIPTEKMMDILYRQKHPGLKNEITQNEKNIFYLIKKSNTKANLTLETINVVENHKTVLFLNAKGSQEYMNGGWVCLGNDSYIKDPTTGKKYKLLKTNGIPICPSKFNFKAVGQKLNFSLEFEPIPKNVRVIDFIENDESSWNLYGISLN